MSTASARTPPPPPVPIGPSVERWRAMSEPERQRFFQEVDLALGDRRQRFFSGMRERLSKMMDDIEERVQNAEAQAVQATEQAREIVLDLAEAYGLAVSTERRQQVQRATLKEANELRLALKATRAWPADKTTEQSLSPPNTDA